MKTNISLLAILTAVILFLGCTSGPQPEENKTNDTNQTVPPVKIITGEQKNQTNEANFTQPPPEEPPPPPPEELEYEYKPDQQFGVYFIDVGGPTLHGNAVLIKKGDLDVLVDAGSAEKGSKVVDFLNAHNVDDIEVLISTDADPRNYGGINTVADNFRIENFWWGDDSFGDQNYSDIVGRMVNSTKDVKKVERGYSMDLNGMLFEVLNPQPAPNRFDDINNDAVVIRITDRNFSLLLTSGIQTGPQGKLISEQPNKIKNKIIQAPYYGVGAGTSNIGIFLITAKPELMIITGSSDDSAINGGSREPYKKLMTQYGILWNETYNNGTLRITSDGQIYDIRALGAGQ